MRTAHQLDKTAILAEHFLLRHLPAEQLDELARYARVQKHEQNEVIVRKSMPGSDMMAVLSGRVKICSVSVDGKEITLSFVNPGELFGEIALLDGKDRSADAVAIEPTKLLVLERRDFLPFLERHPRTCIKLLSVMCERMRNTNVLVEDSVFLDAEARLAKRLVRFAERYGEEQPDGILIRLKLPQRELAALIGVSRESVNKQLRAWQQENWIKLEGGAITITDPQSLKSLAELAN